MIIKRGSLKKELSDKTFIILFIVFAVLQVFDFGLTMVVIKKYGTTDVEGNPFVKYILDNGKVWWFVFLKIVLFPLLYIYAWKVMFLKFGHKKDVNLLYGSVYIGICCLMIFVLSRGVVVLFGN